ncbi:MAG TPA: hypothetical protein VEY07_02130, partial [Thermoplasmata archaeon]|nr:hypothetical protein [Thermoplasmata archaeon]
SGMGLFALPNRATMMNSVPPQRRGVAAGTGTTLVNAGVTLSLGVAILVMSRAMPLPGLEGIFLGSGGLANLPIGPFLSSVHLVFGVSAVLLLAAVVPAALRSPGVPSSSRAKV